MRKINKTACRQYLEPLAPPSPDCGLFLIRKIKYVIRTTVKIVGHRRILILCFYTKGTAPDEKPVLTFTMFQAYDTFLTYDHRPDSKTTWRTAALDNLERSFCHSDLDFVFYSQQDMKRVIAFCAGHVPADCQSDGFQTLKALQTKTKDAEKLRRQRTRAIKIKQRMRGVPPLPKDMASWLAREVVPAYFFYDYRKGKAMQKGICSACRHEIALAGVHHNAQGACPHCGRTLTMKSNGRRGKLWDRATASILQKCCGDKLLLRIIKAYSTWPKSEEQELSWYEEVRVFIGREGNWNIATEPFHQDSSRSVGITPWRRGYPPVMYLYGYNFNAETCGAVYERNLDRELTGTPWQYCQLQKFYDGVHKADMEVLPYLKAYLKHPRLEHLVKLGFFQLASDLVYRGSYFYVLDENRNRTHQILRVQAEDVHFLRELNIDMETLNIFQEYCEMNLKGRQELLRWQLQRQVKSDILPILGYTTPHKMIRFLERQFPATGESVPPAGSRHSSMQDVVREYRDYLEMCVKERYDMKNNFVLFPQSLQVAHDKVARRIKQKADAKMRRDFKIAYRRIMGQLDFEMGGMKIVYPQNPSELVAEGHALHHCVGSYADRVARQECIILFLRRCEDETKPFYTIEIQNRKIVQVRGMQNARATPGVEKFISQWETAVLKQPATLQAA